MNVKKGDYIVFKKRFLSSCAIEEGLVIEVIKDCKAVKVKDGGYSPDWYDLDKIIICSCKQASLKQYLNQWDLGLFTMVFSLVFMAAFIIVVAIMQTRG